MSDTLSERISRVASYSLEPHDPSPWLGKDLESHDWEKGLLVNGLLATGEATDRARALIDRAIETQTTDGQFAYGSLDTKHLDWDVPWQTGTYTSIADPLIPGHGVLDFYFRTGEEAAFDDAVTQFRLQRARLQDPHTKLFRHNWLESPNRFIQSSFWARGNGWVTTAVVDTLAHLPDGHDGRPLLVEILREVCDALRAYQDRTGFWHNVLDDPTSWLETSGTLIFAYSFARGVEMGILDEERFGAAAERAMSICEGVVDDTGRVRRVAKVPGGPQAPPGVTLHGQGWFLLAASRFV
jgi:unsaturated rhamnogalacturonyl hydrolase